jgi:hypothetical protein
MWEKVNRYNRYLQNDFSLHQHRFVSLCSSNGSRIYLPNTQTYISQRDLFATFLLRYSPLPFSRYSHYRLPRLRLLPLNLFWSRLYNAAEITIQTARPRQSRWLIKLPKGVCLLSQASTKTQSHIRKISFFWRSAVPVGVLQTVTFRFR